MKLGNKPPKILKSKVPIQYKWLSYRRETTLQGGLVLAKSRRLERETICVTVDWTFFTRCYGWGATSEYRFKIGDFAPTGIGWPKISGRSGRPPPTILILRKL